MTDFFVLPMILVLVVISLIPAMVAYARGSLHVLPILILCLFLGWTILGWVGALIWAIMSPVRPMKKRGRKVLRRQPVQVLPPRPRWRPQR